MLKECILFPLPAVDLSLFIRVVWPEPINGWWRGTSVFEGDVLALDLGGSFEDFDSACSNFGFNPNSSSCRLVRFSCSLVPLEVDAAVAALVFHKEMALRRANKDPIKTRAMAACIVFRKR